MEFVHVVSLLELFAVCRHLVMPYHEGWGWGEDKIRSIDNMWSRQQINAD